jgi:hypothetical protein
LPQSRYVQEIQKLPLDDPPALFGFHPNASITKQLNATDFMCYELIKMGEIEGVKNSNQGEKKKVQRSTSLGS